MSTIIPGLYGLDASIAWKTLAKDPQKYIDRFSKDKAVQKEIDYFNQKAPKITSVDDLAKDRRLMQFVLNAYGLGDEIKNLGRVKKILTQDPTKEGALATQLADTRFEQMAKDLRLDQGFSKFQLQISRDGITKKYIQNQFEVALGEQDAGLRQAAYFARTAHAGSIGDVYNILGDKILRDVVQTTYSIPAQLAIQPVETQAAYLASRIDLSKIGSSTTTSVSAAQLTRAKSDYGILQSSLATSDAALKQIKSLSTVLSDLVGRYGTLTADTDPSGANAALIAQQQAAVPELIRFDELLSSGQSTIDAVKGQLTNISNIFTNLQKPDVSLSDMKTYFSSLVSDINTAINNAGVQTPSGATENVLLNGSNDTINVVINTGGTTITMSRYDATELQSMLTSAESAFNAVTDKNDTANLLAAQGRILTAIDRANAMGTQIATDRANYDTAVEAQPFYATLNSASLIKGQNSIDDSLTRIGKIEDLLKKIGTIATESAARLPSADRSDLQTTFNDYKAQIRSLIENAGDVGLDNLLNNSPDIDYEISGGQNIHVKGGYNLLAQISDVLDTGDITTQAGASALKISSIQVAVATDKAKAGLGISNDIIDRAVAIFDPRGSLDSQIHLIKKNLDVIIAKAASEDGKNLLSADQADIKQSFNTGVTLTFRAQKTFKADFSAAIDNIIAQMGNGDAAMASAVDSALDIVDRAKRYINGDNRIGTMELGKLGGLIDSLQPSAADADNIYKVNAFTEKFLTRYLTQNTINNGASMANSPILSLFNTSQSSTDAFSNLMNLSFSLKV